MHTNMFSKPKKEKGFDIYLSVWRILCKVEDCELSLLPMFSKSHQRAPRPPFACRCVEITIRVYKNFHGLNPTMVSDGILGKWRAKG